MVVSILAMASPSSVISRSMRLRRQSPQGALGGSGARSGAQMLRSRLLPRAANGTVAPSPIGRDPRKAVVGRGADLAQRPGYRFRGQRRRALPAESMAGTRTARGPALRLAPSRPKWISPSGPISSRPLDAHVEQAGGLQGRFVSARAEALSTSGGSRRHAKAGRLSGLAAAAIAMDRRRRLRSTPARSPRPQLPIAASRAPKISRVGLRGAVVEEAAQARRRCGGERRAQRIVSLGLSEPAGKLLRQRLDVQAAFHGGAKA